jgi:fumarylacetoacetase
MIDPTHDPRRRSWLESANEPGGAFPVQNLPFGIFRRVDSGEDWRGGVAIGDAILDLSRLRETGVVSGTAAEALTAAAEPILNRFMGLGRRHWSALRGELSASLDADAAPQIRDRRAAIASCLVPQKDAELSLPAAVGDYSDFFTSYHHAINCGRINRPHQPLSPSFKHMPIGYHGRASTIVVSGTPIRRPLVQAPQAGQAGPRFGPCGMLDYEGELAFHVGAGNALGEPIPLEHVQEHLFGCTLLNDWTARDAQAWEKLGSGPLLAKDFATTISPWVVTMEALEPFRTAASQPPPDDPEPLPYLDSAFDRAHGGIDIIVEVSLLTETMRRRGEAPYRLSRASFAEQYFTIGQMATHHASNGCRLRPGDILGSGTVSNEDPQSWGCLLERTYRGREPLSLPNGERRAFLEDGDEVVMTAHCERPGFVSIGFGECRGRVLAAPATHS